MVCFFFFLTCPFSFQYIRIYYIPERVPLSTEASIWRTVYWEDSDFHDVSNETSRNFQIRASGNCKSFGSARMTQFRGWFTQFNAPIKVFGFLTMNVKISKYFVSVWFSVVSGTQFHFNATIDVVSWWEQIIFSVLSRNFSFLSRFFSNTKAFYVKSGFLLHSLDMLCIVTDHSSL